MTKRRAKNAKPTGSNKSLGNALQNRVDARYAKSSANAGRNIAVEEAMVSFKICNVNSSIFQCLGKSWSIKGSFVGYA